MMKIKLRNLKSSDLEVLLKTENDKNLWIHSVQDKPFSKSTIKNYIKNASIQSILEAKQKRFVITSNKDQTLGFIDLFEYQFYLNKASIGIVVLDQYRRTGIGYESIKLLESYCLNIFGIKKLCASINPNNKKSIKLFQKCGFVKSSFKLYEKNIK